MDLRIIKTKKAIREAFFSLRRNSTLDKVKVKDICALAMINKTTFYKHYEDIYALSDELEKEVVDMVIANLTAKGEIFTNPSRFITELPKALNANHGMLYPLFHDNFDKLFVILEKRLKCCYSRKELTDEEDIVLTFAIGGALHTMRQLKFERNCDDALLTENLSKILKKLNELK